MPIPLQQTSIDHTKAYRDKFNNSEGAEQQEALQKQYDILKARGLPGDIAKGVLANPERPFTPYIVNNRFEPGSWQQVRGMIPYNKVVQEFYKKSDRAGRKGGGITPYGTSFWKGGIAGQDSLEGEKMKPSMWDDQDNFFDHILSSDDPLYAKDKQILQDLIHENRPVFMNHEHFTQMTPMSEDEWLAHEMMNDWKNLAGPEKFERAIMAIGGGAEGILNIFGNAFKEIGKVQQSDMPVEFKATLTGQAIGQGLEQGNLRDLPELTQGVSNWVANRFRSEGDQYKANYERYLDTFAWQQDRTERMSAAILPGLTEVATMGTVDNFVPWFNIPAKSGKAATRTMIQGGAAATTEVAKLISGVSKGVAVTAALPRKGTQKALSKMFNIPEEKAGMHVLAGIGVGGAASATNLVKGIPGFKEALATGAVLGAVEAGARFTGKVADNLATASWVLTQPATQRRLLWRMADTVDAAKFPRLQKMALWAAQHGGDRAVQATFETVYGAASAGVITAALQAMASNGDWDVILQSLGGGATFGAVMGGSQGLRGSDNGVASATRTQGSIDAYQQQDGVRLPQGSNTPEKLLSQESYGRLWDETGNDPFTAEMSRSERMAHLNTETRLHQKRLFEQLPKRTQEFIATNWEATGSNPNILYFDNGTTYRSFVANYFGRKIPTDQPLPAGWRDPVSGQIYVDMSRPQMAAEALHQTVVHETVHGEIGKWLHEGDVSTQSSRVLDVLEGYVDPSGVPFTLPNGQVIRLNSEAVRFRDGYDRQLGELKDLGIKESALHLADEMLSMESQQVFSENPNVWKTMSHKRPGLLGILANATRATFDKLGIKEGGPAQQQRMIRNYKAMQAQNYRAESITADEGIQFRPAEAERRVPGLTGSDVIPVESLQALRSMEEGRRGGAGGGSGPGTPRGSEGDGPGGDNVVHDYFQQAVGKRIRSKIEIQPGMRAQWMIRNKRQFHSPEVIESIDTENGLVYFKDYKKPVPIKQVRPSAGFSGQVVGKGPGNEGTRLPDEFKNDLRQHPKGAALVHQFEQIEQAMGEGNLMTIAYSNRIRSQGDNNINVRDIVPIQWYVTHSGNISIQGWDMGAVRYNLHRLQEGGYITDPSEFQKQMVERMDEITERVRGKDLTQVLDLLGEYRIGNGPGDNTAMLIYAALGTPPSVLEGKNPELAAYMEQTKMKHVSLGSSKGTFKGFRAADLYSAGTRFDNNGAPMRGPNFRYQNIKAAMRPYSPTTGMPRPQLSPGESAPKVDYPSELINGIPQKGTPFLERQRPANDVKITTPSGEKTHSMVQPMRTGLIQSDEAGYFNFQSEKELDVYLGDLLGQMFKWGKDQPEDAKSSLNFYPGFARSAADLSRDANGKLDLDVADMNVRALAYTSVRASVDSNASKGAQTIASPFSKLGAGYKAGSMTQVKGLGQIFTDWQNGKPFDMTIPGVANKVRNFYLNGSAELLPLAIKEGIPEPKIIEYAEKLNKSLQDISIGREIKSIADVQELIMKMDQQNTTDMWDMASKGAAWPGFVFTEKKPNYYWTDPKAGEVFDINSPEAQEVFRWHQRNAEGVKVNKKGEQLGKVIKDWSDLTTQEKRSLKYDAENGTITLFREKNDAGLSAGGESAVYERAQAISGMLADRINQMGGFMGKNIWTARDIQQYLWGMEKSQNPLPGNRDFSSYDDIVNNMYDILQATQNSKLDTTEVNVGKGIGFLKAMQRSYAALGSQIVPTKAMTVEPGPWRDFQNEQLDRLRQEGDPDPELTFTHAVADAMVPALQGLQDMQFKSNGKSSFKFGTQFFSVPAGGVSLLAGKHVYSNNTQSPKQVPVYLDRNGSTVYYEFPPGDTQIQHNNFDGLNFTIDEMKVQMDGYTPEGSNVPLITPSIVLVGHGDAVDASLAAKTVSASTGQQTGVLIREKDPSEHFGSIKGQPVPEKDVIEFNTGSMTQKQIQELAIKMTQIKDENGHSVFPGFLPTESGVMFSDISYNGNNWGTAVENNIGQIKELADRYGISYKIVSKIIETYGPSTKRQNQRIRQAARSTDRGTNTLRTDAQPGNPGTTQPAGIPGGSNGGNQQPAGGTPGSTSGGSTFGSTSNPGRNPGSSEPGTFRVSGPESSAKFLEGIQYTQKRHKFGAAVQVKEAEFYSNPANQMFMTPDGDAGVVVSQSGDLVSVFNKGSGDIRAVLREAAPHAKTLDAFDINNVLPDLYDNFGFVPISRTKWNDEFAPKNWNYELMGRPDVVLMVRDPSQYLRKPNVPYAQAVRDVPLFDGPDAWDQAAALQKAAVEKMQGVVHAEQPINEHRYMQLAQDPQTNARNLQSMVNDAATLSGDRGGVHAPVEYDTNGNVIPLGTRFNLPEPVNYRDTSDPLSGIVQSRLMQTVSKAPTGYRHGAPSNRLNEHIEGVKQLGKIDKLQTKVAAAGSEVKLARAAHRKANSDMLKAVDTVKTKIKKHNRELKTAKTETQKENVQLKIAELKQLLKDESANLSSSRTDYIKSMNKAAKLGKVPSTAEISEFSSKIQADMVAGRISENEGGHLWSLSQYYTVKQNDVSLFVKFNEGTLQRKTQDWISELAAIQGDKKVNGIKVTNPPKGLRAPVGWKKVMNPEGQLFIYRTSAGAGKTPAQIAKGWGKTIRIPQIDGQDNFMMVVKRGQKTSAIEIQNPTEAEYYMNNLPDVKDE